MAWSHCENCGEAMDFPSVREAAEGVQLCWHCGAENEPRRTVADVLEEFEERLLRLECKELDA